MACQKISHCIFTLRSMTELYQEHSDSFYILKLTRLPSPFYPCIFYVNVPQNHLPFPTDTTQETPGGLKFLEGADMGLTHEAERPWFWILPPMLLRWGGASCLEPTFLSTLCSIGKALWAILERQKLVVSGKGQDKRSGLSLVISKVSPSQRRKRAWLKLQVQDGLPNLLRLLG